jgi:hypothetical protein
MADQDFPIELASANGRLVCKKCGSVNIGKDPKFRWAVVQELTKETKEPIGKPTTFYIFQCLACGEGCFLEKYDVREKPD